MTLALVNGNIITMSESNPKSEAVLIEGENISKVGSTSEIMAALNPEESREIKPIDLNGKTVVPGFNDAHTHFMNLGLNFLRADLSQVRTLEDALEMVKERVATTPTGDWILAVDFDETQWTPEADRRLPTLTELDEISQERPIILRRVCGHIAVANSKALKLIEEYINTNKLEDWFELIDNETGILLEDLALSTNKIVNPTQAEMEEGLVKAIEHAHSLGVTSVRDIVNLNAIEVYRKFLRNGKLKIRISGYVKIEQFDEFLKNKSKYQDSLDENNLKICGAKLFLDGSLGARTAALSEPYIDAPDNTGMLLFSDEELAKHMKMIIENNYQAMVHAIGDKATQQFIDIYSKISDESAGRHSLEHLEVITQAQVNSIHELGLIASMQPNFAGQWSVSGGMNEVRLGPERIEMCNAYNSILEENIPMAFGSDCMPFNPLYGIHCAVNHSQERQRVSAYEALRAYTLGSAYVSFDEAKKGSIEAGKFADLVVLSNDILAPENAGSIKNIQVEMTILGGEIVYYTFSDMK